ncbi:uncharacterized protein PRCAT00006040001 [Priceomyces carsonii]|uniref:uncharacterized protein n=1 Tax=Priceomyces carsonii TaxID=28549 RepID=UPI002EDADEAB|nr:unnamed protein product [Priceomyces carsonii]
MSITVLVTGATGFIAQHIVVELLKNGYFVIGTVRSKEKGERLQSLLDSESFQYEVVTDIQKEDALDEVINKHPQISIALHTASPFHFKSNDPEKDLLLPAVNGTKNALKLFKKSINITRVVVTSSYAAIAPAKKEIDHSFTISELTWNDVTWEEALTNPISGYRGSKTFAERAAWDFTAEEKPDFVLTTVNPGFVFGPQAFDSDVRETLNTSSEVINSVIKLKEGDDIPAFKGCFVDVRDVAQAHLVAFEKESTKNKRLLMSAGRFCTQDILDILRSNFPSLKAKLPAGEVGSGPSVTATLAKIDNSKTKELLGFNLILLEKSVIDSLSQILEAKK